MRRAGLEYVVDAYQPCGYNPLPQYSAESLATYQWSDASISFTDVIHARGMNAAARIEAEMRRPGAQGPFHVGYTETPSCIMARLVRRRAAAAEALHQLPISRAAQEPRWHRDSSGRQRSLTQGVA